MRSRAGIVSGSPPGVKPGGLTDLLRQVASTLEQREPEPPPLRPGTVNGRLEILGKLDAVGALWKHADHVLPLLVEAKSLNA